MNSKYSVYRQVRYKRTYRTLGKMSWWRVALGVVLIVAVLFISGFVSQRLAARGNFILAEKAMVYPKWMEDYKPETKAFIEAGVLYENGDYAAAAEAFSLITGVDAAENMLSLTHLRMAERELGLGNFKAAFENIEKAVPPFPSEEDGESYLSLLTSLSRHFANDAKKLHTIENLISAFNAGTAS